MTECDAKTFEIEFYRGISASLISELLSLISELLSICQSWSK